MKFIEFPPSSVTTSNAWASTLIWKNQTNSYAVVMGWQPLLVYPPSPLNTEYLLFMNIGILDSQNNSIGLVYGEYYAVTLVNGTTAVWNGTAIESTTAQYPIQYHTLVDNTGHSIIPPQCSMWLAARYSGTTTVNTSGGWGFLLDEDELKDAITILIKTKKNQKVIINDD